MLTGHLDQAFWKTWVQPLVFSCKQSMKAWFWGFGVQSDNVSVRRKHPCKHLSKDLKAKLTRCHPVPVPIWVSTRRFGTTQLSAKPRESWRMAIQRTGSTNPPDTYCPKTQNNPVANNKSLFLPHSSASLLLISFSASEIKKLLTIQYLRRYLFWGSMRGDFWSESI